jgi:Protein of unknown function (DUF541)
MLGKLGLCATTALLLIGAAEVQAADGFKATAVAVRRVPADILTVNFHLIERSIPEEKSKLRTEELRIRDEVKKTGVTILAWTSRVAMTNAGFSTTTFNYISSTSK